MYLAPSDDAKLKGVQEDIVIKQQAPGLVRRIRSEATASALKKVCVLGRGVSFDFVLLNAFSVLWQAKPDVKWLLEFIQRGQRENKNITRELQLQPLNMTSVCFCAFDFVPTFNGRFWLQDKQTVIGLA